MKTETTTTDNNIIAISVNVNKSDVFKAVIEGRSDYWVHEYEISLDSDEVWEQNKVCDIKIKCDHPTQDNKIFKKTITPEQLCKAYLDLLLQGQTHCGGHALNPDDYDSCFGDLVLQQALFNEIVFG